MAVSLEVFDDVAWEDQGTPTQLLQLKHHVKSVRGLGDMNADVWRTLKVWLDMVDVGDAGGPQLCLVTTQPAAAGSAVGRLRPADLDERDESGALQALELAARMSKDKASSPARQEFLNLSAKARRVFVGRIRVLDRAPVIGDLDAAVRLRGVSASHL